MWRGIPLQPPSQNHHSPHPDLVSIISSSPTIVSHGETQNGVENWKTVEDPLFLVHFLGILNFDQRIMQPSIIIYSFGGHVHLRTG